MGRKSVHNFSTESIAHTPTFLEARKKLPCPFTYKMTNEKKGFIQPG